jgi:hypothetical protein
LVTHIEGGTLAGGFEYRVFRKIFGTKRDDVIWECRKLHNEELYDLYSSPHIVRVIKSRIRWAGHVARMGRREVYTVYWWEKLNERNHLGDPGVDGMIILGWIFKKWVWE